MSRDICLRCRDTSQKRLKGFEPSTFCMAIRQVSEGRRTANVPLCRYFVAAPQRTATWRYARMCADMQRFGNFGAEVPETRRAGFIPAPATRYPQVGPINPPQASRLN